MAEVQVRHPDSGDVHTITIPDDHDGSRVKVEFPDGATTYTEGFDPAEATPEPTDPGVELRTSIDTATGTTES